MDEYIGEISLDLNCITTLPVICAGQYDKGRKLLIHILADGEPFSAAGSTAIIKGSRADKSAFTVECTVDGSGNVVSVINETVLALSGVAYAKVVLLDNQKTYSTQIFLIDVNDGLEGAVIDVDNFSAINSFIQDLVTLLDYDSISEVLDHCIKADASLSQSGQAADAKATGDAIAAVDARIPTIDDSNVVNNVWEQGRINTTTGVPVSSSVPSAIRSKNYIPLDENRRGISILFGNYNIPSQAGSLYCLIFEYKYENSAYTFIRCSDIITKTSDVYTYEFDSETTAFKIVLRYTSYDTSNPALIYPQEGYRITLLWSNDAASNLILQTKNQIDNYLPSGYETISKSGNDIKVKYENAYIGSNGRIIDQSPDASHLHSVTEAIELNAGDTFMFTHNVTNNDQSSMIGIAETDAQYSFFKDLISSNGTVTDTLVADRHMFVAATFRQDVTPVMKLIRRIDYVFSPQLDMAHKGVIGVNGVLIMNFSFRSYNSYRISEPIKVYKGDVIEYTAFALAGYPMIVKFFDRFNTYKASQLNKNKIMASASGTSSQTVTWMVDETCYVVFQALIDNGDYSCTITRKYDDARIIDSNDRYTEENYALSKHNYVDIYDYVPRLNEKRTNSILTYYGDNKKSEKYIVNAVAYPNGEIIACRAGGDVVKIANDGTETVLLTIANSQDWRGMFMDSKLNVYVSPHSSTFSPGISKYDRGLYRLQYGANQFQKVISLCRQANENIPIIPLWSTNSSFTTNNLVFKYGSVFVCKQDHTSDDFETDLADGKWESCPNWAANTDYNIGNAVVYNSCCFICNTDHRSATHFEIGKWNAATEHMNNDDTIWTMCEDDLGNLYAGVYAHSIRTNAAIYRSTNNGVSWFYQHNFIQNGTLPRSNYGDAIRHVHCVNFNPYNNCLYAAVGEVNTIVKSSNRGTTWVDLNTPCYYGQPTYVLGVKDGLVIGSDGHYSCGVSKLMIDDKTMKLCGRTAPGFIFNIRRSDLTGWLYAWTRIDNFVDDTKDCPPVEAITDAAVLQSWKEDANTSKDSLGMWEEYNAWASEYYPEDAIRPQNAVIMVSKDDGDTWEVIRMEKVSTNYSNICGFITVGYFRDGECVTGFLKPDETSTGKAFVNPIIISEGKKKRTAAGFDLDGEIYIKTNSSTIIPYETSE